MRIISLKDYLLTIITTWNGEPVNNKIVGIVSPKILVGTISDQSYIKSIGWRKVNLSSEDDFIRTHPGDFLTNIATFNVNSNINLSDVEYRNIDKSKLLTPNSVFNGDFERPLINSAYSNNILAIEMSDKLEDIGQVQIFREVILKSLTTPHANLFNLQYKAVTNILNLTDTQITYKGGAYVNHFALFNIEGVSNSLTGWFQNYLVVSKLE
jgi:hypothetical protein